MSDESSDRRTDTLGYATDCFVRAANVLARWHQRSDFAILQMGFGHGHAFLASLAAWQLDPHRSAQLHFVAIEAHPPTRQALEKTLSPLLQQAWTPDGTKRSVEALLGAWPVLTANVHVMAFELGAVTLQLVVADAPTAIRHVVGLFDAFYLDDAWDAWTLKALARLSRGDAIVAFNCDVVDCRHALTRAGFVTQAHGTGDKPKAPLVAKRVRRGPQHDSLARLGAPTRPSHALIIGAGLAGAHVARALAQRGVRCTVLDRHLHPAGEGSSGVVGIFHGVVHGSDGSHSQIYRTAALYAASSHGRAIAAGVEGAIGGMLRVTGQSIPAMQAQHKALGLPRAWADAIAAENAAAVTGIDVTSNAWHFPHGGWINPKALVSWLLDHEAITFEGGVEVQALMRHPHGWQSVEKQQRVIASADVVIVANAWDAARLLPHALWPLGQSRGQSTMLPANTPGLKAPKIPLSGNGYVVTRRDGSVMCGASSHVGDNTSQARDSDAHENLEKLRQLTGGNVDTNTPMGMLINHVGWRTLTPDRLPIVGAVPALHVIHTSDNVHRIAREPGLYTLTALGPRGHTLAPLMAEVVAASILREPVPLAAPLLNTVDAARYVAQAMRRQRVKDSHMKW